MWPVVWATHTHTHTYTRYVRTCIHDGSGRGPTTSLPPPRGTYRRLVLAGELIVHLVLDVTPHVIQVLEFLRHTTPPKRVSGVLLPGTRPGGCCAASRAHVRCGVHNHAPRTFEGRPRPPARSSWTAPLPSAPELPAVDPATCALVDAERVLTVAALVVRVQRHRHHRRYPPAPQRPHQRPRWY